MLQLTEKEWENLKSQNAISSWGGRRKKPYAFTEHGVFMTVQWLAGHVASDQWKPIG